MFSPLPGSTREMARVASNAWNMERFTIGTIKSIAIGILGLIIFNVADYFIHFQNLIKPIALEAAKFLQQLPTLNP